MTTDRKDELPPCPCCRADAVTDNRWICGTEVTNPGTPEQCLEFTPICEYATNLHGKVQRLQGVVDRQGAALRHASNITSAAVRREAIR